MFEIVYPVVDDRSEARDQHHRDAMNVSAGIKWKTSAFVTRNKRLLNKDGALRNEFKGFRVLTPESALSLVEAHQAEHP